MTDMSSYELSTNKSLLQAANCIKINKPTKSNYPKKSAARVSKKNGSKVFVKGAKVQLNSGDRFPCLTCGKSYLRKRHLQRHVRDECIGIIPRFNCDLCPSRFRRKYHMVRHLTSKHGVPRSIAALTKGSSRQTTSKVKTETFENGGGTASTDNYGNCDNNNLPENLTMRKANGRLIQPMQYNPQTLQHTIHHHHFNIGSNSPSLIASGDSGSDCNGGDPLGTSPIPPAHLMPMPTYGLTGAITAISAAAAQVEENDAMLLLEAAAAAAAQATANHHNYQHPATSGTNTATYNMTTPPPPPLNENTENVNAVNYTGPSTSRAAAQGLIKSEPLTPGKAAAAAAAASATMNMFDDEWKMKLSLQLISNSLLKKRLMNTMPYTYKNN